MTRLALVLVTWAAALLPRKDRERYLEQWRADVLGARELGLSPFGVAFGAVRTANTRKAPVMLPVGVLALALRLRESRHLGAVLAVMLIANLGGVIVLVI
ncbi:hypothetical protein ABZ816_11790 [Actinosynnema sp. NPDC047251]|uniref:Putative membrane protein n=1 Tax=Saccharothrix espanaensis (strain ATCC 51144 / DSM 44229 / JCM 9112 / NBRC 15066 / NRRL 15764) TaxID=1179773 RepID=K0KFI0_SACES|nr:hypothetical protein [Saccharothrix espanaensis]CCH35278.1 putative membrane protein [Saccharothrix espanaensis DSM 44229]